MRKVYSLLSPGNVSLVSTVNVKIWLLIRDHPNLKEKCSITPQRSVFFKKASYLSERNTGKTPEECEEFDFGSDHPF